MDVSLVNYSHVYGDSTAVQRKPCRLSPCSMILLCKQRHFPVYLRSVVPVLDSQSALFPCFTLAMRLAVVGKVVSDAKYANTQHSSIRSGQHCLRLKQV